MPRVLPNESRSHYLARCIPIVMSEGKTQEQAIGKCEGMFDAARKKDSTLPILQMKRYESDLSIGAKLKSQLGLDHISHVYMSRLVNAGPLRVYIVAYDSRYPDAPITSSLFRGRKAPFITRYPFTRRLRVLPFLPIERYRPELVGAMILVVDTAGRFADLDKVSSVLESKDDLTVLRLGEATLYDLKTANNRISAITQKYRNKRNRALGPENRTAKLVDVLVDVSHDTVTFVFSTPATKVPAQQTYPSEGYGLHPNPSGRYIIAIEVTKFFSWLHTAPEGATVTAKDIKDVLEVADVKLSSTSPSFFWQGMAWNLSQIDAAIYPVSIPPDMWGPRHFYSLLDKHTYGVISQISFFLPIMANVLTKKLHRLGHISRPVYQNIHR